MPRKTPRRRFPCWPSLATMALVACASLGCNRAYYRNQADCEVQSLVECASSRLDRPMTQRFSIEGDPKSRFFDPNDPDCPPMPPDDPTSHTYMNWVDGKCGYPCWDQRGFTPYVENPTWRRFLPYNDRGQIVLNRELAYQTALVNSPEYQRALENLYLSALKVTEERFRFDVQFFGGTSELYTANGRLRNNGDTRLDAENTFGLERKFSAGGELAVGLANSFMWQFAGPDSNTANTLINFNFVQPLLRAAGRDYQLENLTDAERALLANIRQFERFRRGFYTEIVAGGGNVGLPSSGSLGITGGRSSGATSASGYFGLLQEQIRIRNQKANITGLQDSLYRLIEMYRFNQLRPNNTLQVEQARQQLLNSQSRLLSLNNAYENRLDTFKITLGLPPDMPVVVRDPMLDAFELVDPRLTATQDHLHEVLSVFRDEERAITPETLRRFSAVAAETREQMRIVQEDLNKLKETLPLRIRNLEMLANRPEIREGNIDRSAVDVSELEKRVRLLDDPEHPDEGYPKLEAELETTLEAVARYAAAADDPALAPEEFAGLRQPALRTAEELSSHLMMLSLVQARARLDSLTLVPIELSPERALQIAAANRRDWMNARAELVDRWRQIEVRADELESDLDIQFSGSIDTVGDNPLKFRSSTGSLSAGLEFDAPLTRLIERNAYRRSLIEYQQAKREFYGYRDSINQTLRSTLRAIRLSQINFELQRAAVLVAIVKVDLAQLNLMAPPEAGQGANSNLARDVTDALQQLLNAQNEFLSVWVDYQTQRMTLDLDLGTMRLDGRGIWVDPGALIESEMGPAEPDAGPTPPAAGLDEVPPGLEDEAILPPGFEPPQGNENVPPIPLGQVPRRPFPLPDEGRVPGPSATPAAPPERPLPESGVPVDEPPAAPVAPMPPDASV